MSEQPYSEKLVVSIGQLLSKFSFVAGTLCGYVFLTLIMYFWLVLDFSQWRGYPPMIAYDVAFGGSPLPYADVLSNSPGLWKAVQIFHILAWLIVPILAATMVDAAYRMFEENQRRKERRLRRSIRAWGKSRNIPEEELRDLIDEALDTFPLWLKRVRRKKRKHGS
jgi:hypothetical protein